MYIPSLFADDPDQIAQNVRDWPFATVVTAGGLGLFATHVPLVLVGSTRLVGHLARSNPHPADFGGQALAIFHGPHAYVSSEWYADPSRQVPTWNYLAVHATGTIRPLPDPLEALDLLRSTFVVPTGDDEHQAFVANLARAIVGFEITVDRWEAKAKLSQNRDPDDRVRVRDALLARDEGDDARIVDQMVRRAIVPRR